MASFPSSFCRSATLLVLALTSTIGITPIQAEFNFEVGRRIHERVSGFMKAPTSILLQISRYRDNQGFPHYMSAPDRNDFFRFNDALMETYPEFQSIYYGLEDGMFAGHGFNSKIANYREPGHSGYVIDNVTNMALDEDMQKHYVDGCVDTASGEPVMCEMKVGGKYTECINDCRLEKCADELSQRDCEGISDTEERKLCEEGIKWCTSYEIKESTEDVRRGYVVRSTHCINSNGIPSETPGEIVKKGTKELGNCYFGDTDKLVQRRNISGNYAYCGGDGEICNDVYSGGYTSRDYDPRWRGWYIATKAMQVPNWSPPYAFFSTQEIGITFSLPIYSKNSPDVGNVFDEGAANQKNVFEGVLAVDFTFTDISNFLTANYKSSAVVVAIFEKDEPHYIVATSTGSTGTKIVLKENEDMPCPGPDFDCKAIRVSAGELDENEIDAIIRASFWSQKDAGFPQEQLTSSRAANDTTVYGTQVKSFTFPDADLSWQIMIMMPTVTEDSDTILRGDQLFGILVAIVALGVCICAALAGLLIKRRKERAVIYSDWRFLSAFVASCALLNLSCLSFLGPNTDDLCLLRQWLVHFFFAVALSLLFVKTYRMYKLVGAADTFRTTTISHSRTLQMALPLVIIQTMILLTFTFYDPSKQTEIIESSGPDITHRLVCSHEGPAFFITMLIFEGGLLLVGCVLAFKTRNLHSQFNESKQIILSMYDTAVIATLLLLVGSLALTYQGEQRLLISLGIFWTTCFASCVFVLPRTRATLNQTSLSQRQPGVISNSGAAIVSTRSKTSNHNLTVAEIRRRSSLISLVSSTTDENRVTAPDTSSSLDVESGLNNNKSNTLKEVSEEDQNHIETGASFSNNNRAPNTEQNSIEDGQNACSKTESFKPEDTTETRRESPPQEITPSTRAHPPVDKK